MISRNSEHLLWAALLAVTGVVATGCRTESTATPPDKSYIIIVASAPPPPQVQQKKSQSKRSTESKTDADHGRELWNSFEEAPDPTPADRLPSPRIYHDTQANLLENLQRMDGYVAQAGAGEGVLSGDDGRDYVSGQFARRINQIVNSYEKNTGLHYPVTGKTDSNLTDNQNNLREALNRLGAMGKAQFLLQNSDYNTTKGVPYNFCRAVEEFFNLEKKFNQVAEKADWKFQPVQVQDDTPYGAKGLRSNQRPIRSWWRHNFE